MIKLMLRFFLVGNHSITFVSYFMFYKIMVGTRKVGQNLLQSSSKYDFLNPSLVVLFFTSNTYVVINILCIHLFLS